MSTPAGVKDGPPLGEPAVEHGSRISAGVNVLTHTHEPAVARERGEGTSPAGLRYTCRARRYRYRESTAEH